MCSGFGPLPMGRQLGKGGQAGGKKILFHNMQNMAMGGEMHKGVGAKWGILLFGEFCFG